MRNYTFVSLLVFHVVIYYFLFLQYEYYDSFKELQLSNVYYASSVLTFLLLLSNGVMYICDIHLYTKLFAYTGISMGLMNSILYNKLKPTSPPEVQTYIQNSIFFGEFLFVTSIVLLMR